MQKINTTAIKFSIILILSIFAMPSSNAQEGASILDKETDNFNWQFTAGISILRYQDLFKDGIDPNDPDNMLSISLMLDLYYKGFFIQSKMRGSEGALGDSEIGYQIKVTPLWSLELISQTYIRAIDIDEYIKHSNVAKEDSMLNNLASRDEANGIGLRYSKFIGADILSLDASYIVSIGSGNNLAFKLQYSHFIPYRNWSIYSNIGATYYGKDVANYYVGIDESEVTANRPYYQTTSGAYELELDMFAIYPLTKKWTFNVGAKVNHYSSNIKSSPIVDRSGESILSLGVMYAF